MNDTAAPLLPYPAVSPYATGLLPLDNGHQMYFEECGNPHGLPVLFVHGGPGSCSSPMHRQLADPQRCRLILFDQRGCGLSQPSGHLLANTSDHLVEDMAQLRRHLEIDQWLIVGGSWGAGLALAFAAAHPESCLGLVLRGVFLGRPCDLDWFFQEARQLLPQAWESLAQTAPLEQQGKLVEWLYRGLHEGTLIEQRDCARAWSQWENIVSDRQIEYRHPNHHQTRDSPATDIAPYLVHDAQTAKSVRKYRLQSHYLHHHCFWETTPLLQRMDAISTLPTAILHGQLDWICRPSAAWDLHQALPVSRLRWLHGCGHSPFEPPMAHAIADAVSYFLQHRNFSDWGSHDGMNGRPTEGTGR